MATENTLAYRKLRLMTAVKTPYDLDGQIDLAAFDKHVEHQIQNGVEALIIGGTTGEGHLFSWEEHLVLIAHTKATFKDRVMVVGNTGSNHTAESVNATKKGFAVGMDCSLLINPYYGKTNERGILLHLEAAMEFGPAIIYNVPGRTGQDIKPETMAKIQIHEHFVCVKECMGPDRIRALTEMGIASWSGNDDSCHHERHDCGAMGVISVTANVVPGLFSKMMKERDDETNEKLGPLYKWLFAEPNPIGVNTLMMMLGAAKPVFRLPYVNRDLAARQEGAELIKPFLEHCPVSEAGVQVLADEDFALTMG